MTSSNDYIKIAILENAIEAQLMGSILEERGIPHRIRSFYDTAYNGLFQFQKGWGNVLAPPEYRVEIMEIMTSIRSTTDAPAAP